MVEKKIQNINQKGWKGWGRKLEKDGLWFWVGSNLLLK
jgi:hypothetical protein